MKKGYVQIYIIPDRVSAPVGVGMAVRAAGGGLKVWIAIFDTSYQTVYSYLADRFSDQIVVEYFSSFLTDQVIQDSVFQTVKQILISGTYDMVILENVTTAAAKGRIPESALLDLVDSKSDHTELILTGTYSGKRLIELADLATEMELISVRS